MGQKIGEYIKKAKPNGGKVCTIEGNPAADNILRRAQGMRDALTGKKGLRRSNGEGGWTEVAGCPVFTNDDGAKGVQAMTDILAANPEPRRLRHHGRLAAVRRAAALPRPDQAAGRQDRQQRAS